MIKVDGLTFRYKKDRLVLKNITFSLEDGYLMCLIGRNGAGKTTLLQAMYGVLACESGEVIYNDKRVVAGKGTQKVSYASLKNYHNEVAYVGNVAWVLDSKSVEENVGVLRTLYADFDGKEYERLCTYFGLTKEDEKKLYSELSTGQKMLFQIAFAMGRHPKLLLLDEPFANLDPIVKVDMAQLFQDKIEQENVQIILSTHLVDDISDQVDYVGVMKDGELTEFGDREQILQKKDAEGLRDFIRKDSEK